MTQNNSLDHKMEFFQEMMLQMVTRVEEAIYQARSAFEQHDIEAGKKSRGERTISLTSFRR